VRIVEVTNNEPGSGADESAFGVHDQQDGEEGSRKTRSRRGSFSRTQQALRQSFRHKLRPPKEGSGETTAVPVAAVPVFSDPMHSFHVR
jgi:hypothetical protein